MVGAPCSAVVTSHDDDLSGSIPQGGIVGHFKGHGAKKVIG